MITSTLKAWDFNTFLFNVPLFAMKLINLFEVKVSWNVSDVCIKFINFIEIMGYLLPFYAVSTHIQPIQRSFSESSNRWLRFMLLKCFCCRFRYNNLYYLIFRWVGTDHPIMVRCKELDSKQVSISWLIFIKYSQLSSWLEMFHIQLLNQYFCLQTQ